jgi:hypothetical protein
MSNLDKNIIITPNVGANGDPQIVFSAANTTANAQNITMRAYPTSNGTLSVEGSAGQLFSITNQLTGTLFSVNDISGIPSIEVLDTGRVNLAQYNGTVVIGANTSANASTSNTTGELVVYGGIGVTGNIYVGGTNAGANGIYTDILRYAANGLPWVMGSGSGGGGSGNVSASGWTSNTIITANSNGYLTSSNALFIASNNAIVVPNVVITQAATGSFPLSFGQGLGNKIALYEGTIPSNGTGYGFGIQANRLQIFHANSTDFTSIGHGSSSGFTEQFRIASVASAVNYVQATGNTTSNAATISAQGSDTNIDLYLQAKGLGSILSPNKLWIAKSNTISSVAPTTITLANYYAAFGGAEYATNSYRLLGFGYMQPPGFGILSYQFPAYMGFQEISSAGATYGDLIFGTRNTTSNNDVPITRMRITSNGSVVISNTAFDTLNVASGGILANTVLINQRYDQGTGILQANGSISVAGNTITQNFYVQGNNNYLTYSQDFSNAIWAKTALTVSTGFTAPNGTATAQKLVEDSSTAQHLINQFSNIIAVGTICTYSVYAKAAEWTSFQMQLGSGGAVATFNLSAVTAVGGSGGSATAIAATITSVGNGWYRCTLTGTYGNGNNYIYKTAATYTGDSVSGMYVWGAQTELGYVASAYTPTTSVTVINTNNVYVYSGNVYVGNTSSYSTTNNAINVIGSIGTANSIYVGNRVGFANSNNISVVYQSYNSSTNSLDVVFG